ncbi:hypothetical protein [Nocardiopsis quinghaiensis]|uniref:hypothetical protein n=1 Tax=Nocardiopsis quinghaiensis TaxID=464995 RepID=UPI001238D250|nr:hypothetical protein [Nocardiopsis quinghaiensis]
MAGVMARVPWTRYVDIDGIGVHRCLTQMFGVHARQVLGLNVQEPQIRDPWGGCVRTVLGGR